jgi:arylsulfatase A-like enzyme
VERFGNGKPTAGNHYHPHASIWWDKKGHTAEEYSAQRGMYDAAIAWLDDELGRLFEALDSRGLSQNTLIIVTSDHGEEFGEHGALGHGGEVYMDLIRVPLVFVFPGRVPAGVRVAPPVTQADLPTTILDLIGETGHRIPGQTLASTWRTDPVVPPSPILSQENSGNSKGGILLGGWHYMRRQDGLEELYHLATDPTETTDLAQDPDFAERLARMREALDNAMTKRR